MELSVSLETTFFNMKLQLKICPSSAEDRGRIDTSVYSTRHLSSDDDTIPTRNGRELGEIWVSKVGTNF